LQILFSPQIVLLHQNQPFMAQWTYRLDKILQQAEACWAAAGSRPVLALFGPMGAGKTTLAEALCRVKKVTSPVGSPTFSIINEYSYPGGALYHIDLYRLKDEQEAIRAGVEDCLYSGQPCLLEWPERAPGILPPDTVRLFLEVLDDQTRRLSIPEN
jgi:tRNA threonylcarbamoyladenosine biosynthesis protein TsaE